jgi:lipopolysaccharide export system protein LptA
MTMPAFAPDLLSTVRIGALALAGFVALPAGTSVPALAQTAPAARPATPAPAAPAAPAKRGRGGGDNALGGLNGDSKEPIKIDADKLDVLDKENRAIFTGNVVAVQGETTVRCTVMTVFYEGRGGGQGGAGAARAAPTPAATGAAAGSNDSSIKKIDCKGPVTVVSKTQAATSDNAIFDRANNIVIMTGNVALNDGPNITRGDKLVYNTVTGVANVTSGGRVQGFFVPNSADNKDGAKPAAAGGAKPAAGAKPATPTN